MAADVITTFKLETTQFDSKLRDTAKELQGIARQAEKAGKDFAGFDKGAVEAARALGTVASGATNTKDKLRDLVGSFNDAAKAYDKLTEEQKQSDFGKAMAASLDQLQGRIKEAKSELYNTGGILGQLKEKFTINIDAVKLFNMGLTATKAALDVAKDSFFASEQNVDEWGRVVAASESVYEGFLTAINNGDISGYLTRIDQIVQAAREAYNELDKLGTMRTIQGPQFSKQEAENTRMRMMIMTGRYIAPAAGSGMKAAMAEGTVLTPEQIRRIEQKLESGMKSIGALTKNELAQTGKAIDAYYNKLAVTNGMSRSEFRQGTSSWDEFSRKMQGYEDYKRWDAQARAEFARQGGRGYVDFDKSNPYAEYRKWGTFRVDKIGENSYNDLVGLIKQQQQQTNQLYSQMGQTYRTINRAEGVTVRDILKGGKGGSGGGGTFDIGKIAFNVSEVIKPEDFIAQPSVWEQYAEGIKGTFGTIKDSMSNLTNWTKDFDPFNEYLEKQNKLLQEQQTRYNLAGQAASNFGAALAGLDDPAAKAAGTVMQAIASIAMGFAMASSNANTAGTGWGWLAWLAAGTAAMATTISTIHSLTGYAQGGKIEGNSYSGDNIAGLVDGSQLVGLNAGEIVLNQAQQSNVASGLRGGAMSGMRLQTKVKGTELLIWVDNALAQSGRGELVTWGT